MTISRKVNEAKLQNGLFEYYHCLVLWSKDQSQAFYEARSLLFAVASAKMLKKVDIDFSSSLSVLSRSG